MATASTLDEALSALDAYRTKLWLLLGESDADVHGAAACAILLAHAAGLCTDSEKRSLGIAWLRRQQGLESAEHSATTNEQRGASAGGRGASTT